MLPKVRCSQEELVRLVAKPWNCESIVQSVYPRINNLILVGYLAGQLHNDKSNDSSGPQNYCKRKLST